MVFDCVFLIVTHLITGFSLYKISLGCFVAGDLHRAIECAREALRIWQAALPPGHQAVVDAEELVRDLEQIMQ